MLSPGALALVVVSWFLLGLSIVVVAGRVIGRRFVVHNCGIDDALAIAAVAALSGLTAVHLRAVHFGMGQPIATLSPTDIEEYYKCLWLMFPLYNIALSFSKLSIVAQYYRVFPLPTAQLICKIIITVCTAYGLWCAIASFFMCLPVQYYWGVGDGSCMDKTAFWFTNAAFNIASDIVITAFPLPFLVKLHVPKKVKVALFIVFALGSLAFITSCIRLYGVYKISKTDDSVLDGVDIAIWSAIEVSLAIICAGIPTLKPLLEKVIPGLSKTRPTTDGNMARPGSSPYSRNTLSSNRQSRRPGSADEIQIRHSFAVSCEKAEGSVTSDETVVTSCTSNNGEAVSSKGDDGIV